jgi:hypothetical protein
MRSVALCSVLLALAIAPTASTASSQAATCKVSTREQGGSGRATFHGRCNRLPYSLKIDPFSVSGRLGRQTVSFKRKGETLTGKIGSTRSQLSYNQNATITGRLGKTPVHLDVFRAAVTGRVGKRPITCTFNFITPLGEDITCTGGGAGMIVPFLAMLYAAP